MASSFFFSQEAAVNPKLSATLLVLSKFALNASHTELYPKLVSSASSPKINLRLPMNAKSLRLLAHLLPSPHLECGGDSGDELFRRFPPQVGGDAHVVSTREAQRQTPAVSGRHCFRGKQPVAPSVLSP